MPRILAIDYGTKRVGLAVTDPFKLIASALTTVETTKLITYLQAYMQAEAVECFVVGLPKRLNGDDTNATPHIEQFVLLLKKHFPAIPVSRIDERYTSTIATRTMLEMGLKKKDRAKKENIDQISAVLILQTYLQMHP